MIPRLRFTLALMFGALLGVCLAGCSDAPPPSPCEAKPKPKCCTCKDCKCCDGCCKKCCPDK